MTPEQFYWRNKINSFRKNDIREMRIQSLDWMLGCYRKGTIRRRTIINLIPLGNLYSLLHELEEEERYENCAIIKTVIDEIYEQVEPLKEDMSKKRRKEIIELLTNTIQKEQEKIGGGNKELIEKLSDKLEALKEKKY